MPTEQKPINSGFGPTSTARDVIADINLSNKTAIVTGGYSGIGLETTRALAGAGATVIVPAKNPEKAHNALKEISGVEYGKMDLIDRSSIDTFLNNFLASGRPLHILVNNAGIMATGFERDAAGNESQFAVNHLGHFRLAAGLWPSLQKAQGARVISVSSRGHFFGGVDFEDPNFEWREYDKWKSYGQSKSANALFAVELDRIGQSSGIRAFSLHPGRIVSTDLSRHLTKEELRAAGALDANDQIPTDGSVKNIEQGAATNVWCATSPQLDGMGGVYCEDADISYAISADAKVTAGVRPWAIDKNFAKQLWALSQKLTGVEFAVP